MSRNFLLTSHEVENLNQKQNSKLYDEQSNFHVLNSSAESRENIINFGNK